MEKVIDLMYNGSVTIPNEGVEEFQAALSIFQIKGYTIKSVDAAATSENRKKSSQSKPNGAEPENLSLAVKQPSAGVPKKPKKAAASKQVAKQSVNGQPMAHSKRPNVQTSITVNANGVKFIKPNVHATKPQAKSRQAVKEDDNKSAGLKNGHDTEVPINQSNGDSSQDKCPTISANANGVKMIKPNVQPTTPQPEPLPAVNPDDDKNTDLENGHDTEVQINHPNGDSNQNGSESLVNGNGQHTETTPAEEVLNGEVDQPEVMNGEIATNGTSENFNGESKDDEMETVITECSNVL